MLLGLVGLAARCSAVATSLTRVYNVWQMRRSNYWPPAAPRHGEHLASLIERFRRALIIGHIAQHYSWAAARRGSDFGELI